jgi:hypothetical protein
MSDAIDDWSSCAPNDFSVLGAAYAESIRNISEAGVNDSAGD